MKRLILGMGISPLIDRRRPYAAPPDLPDPEISDLYGVGPGQIPMDHRYALGSLSGGNVTAVANEGGAGSAFNLTATGVIPASTNYVTMQPAVYFTLANRAELTDTRLFVVADILAFTSNQTFAGSAVTADRSNIILSQPGDRMTLNRDAGSGFVNAQVPLSPVVSAGLRIYEVETLAGGNISVWVNGVLRGTVANPHASFGVLRIGAGQQTAAGLSAHLYRTLSIITGGDYAANAAAIRRRLAAEYGIPLS